MTRFVMVLAQVALLAAPFAAAPVYGHLTYNLSGYGAGVGGSAGNDGNPADVTADWTNGSTDYTGKLPVNWYAGIHNPTEVHTIQTGIAPNPPPSSMLGRVTTYNAQRDPDLLTTAVLAVAGVSWSDPTNDNQGWGHGLDYGLIHVTPLDATGVLADGPVRLTITLTDDPADGVAVQLAYALYGGWDTSTGAVRHQTFVTSPSPVDNPLNSTGLVLIDYAAAGAAGATLSRSYDVDLTYEGKYTVFVGALGGVAGQYQLTAGVFPTDGAIDEELAECQEDLSASQATVTAMTSDVDADGVPDQRDGCAGTAAGQFVDQAGCSQAQFCTGFPTTTKREKRTCKQADWKNDEPGMKPAQADCAFVKSSGACEAKP